MDAQKQTITINNVTLQLAQPYTCDTTWIGYSLAFQQLEAAWMKLSPTDYPMHPRLVGKPGVGKTTLAIAVAKRLGLPVYLMQCTADTRPEDLLITPIVTEGKQIAYVASPLVTAMLVGGVAILDEGNRMSEKSWASLAALLDHRRYVDSILAGTRIYAHEEFRFVTTMNEDSSVYDLPEYIQSRLSPQIYVDFPTPETEKQIIKSIVPYADDELLELLVAFLAYGHENDHSWSTRDGVHIAKFAMRLKHQNPNLSAQQALLQAVARILGDEAYNILYEEALTKFFEKSSPHSPRPLRPV